MIWFLIYIFVALFTIGWVWVEFEEDPDMECNGDNAWKGVSIGIFWPVMYPIAIGFVFGQWLNEEEEE